jgi:hypothetical protein
MADIAERSTFVGRSDEGAASFESFPVPGRGDDRHDRGGRLGRQQADEPSPLDDPRTRRGRKKLGLDERDRGVEARTVVGPARLVQPAAPRIVFGNRHRILSRPRSLKSGRK